MPRCAIWGFRLSEATELAVVDSDFEGGRGGADLFARELEFFGDSEHLGASDLVFFGARAKSRFEFFVVDGFVAGDFSEFFDVLMSHCSFPFCEHENKKKKKLGTRMSRITRYGYVLD
jgi:hypothetical protein